MSKNNKKIIRLKHNWVIPVGTEFECIDGMTRQFASGNYEALLATSNDSTAHLGIDEQALEDRPELFEIIEK